MAGRKLTTLSLSLQYVAPRVFGYVRVSTDSQLRLLAPALAPPTKPAVMVIADSGSQQPPYYEAERGNCDRRPEDRLKRDDGRP